MTTVRAWWYPSDINNALSVVIIQWQWSEHGYKYLRYGTCSVSFHCLLTSVRAWWYSLSSLLCSVICHFIMTTVRACWYPLRYKTCSISCHHPNTTFRAWVFFSLRHETCFVIVIISWQLSEHDDTPSVWNMLCRFSSSHDNGQSIVTCQA